MGRVRLICFVLRSNPNAKSSLVPPQREKGKKEREDYRLRPTACSSIRADDMAPGLCRPGKVLFVFTGEQVLYSLLTADYIKENFLLSAYYMKESSEVKTV